MALISPGVEVSIIDQSNYLPSATTSIPFILLATAQNKVSATGTGVATGTLSTNANQVYLSTSQRDLVSNFGNPFFYKTTTGTPINGYELNEYGLLAAYSVLGVTNQAYILRADVDLAELTATVVRPTGNPTNGTYWMDLSNTQWGIFEWSAETSTFVNKTPIKITKTNQLSSGLIVDSIGNIGDYAVNTLNAGNPVYYKRPAAGVSGMANTWVLVGSDDWATAWPTVQGTNANPTLTTGNSIKINGTTVTLSGTTVSALATSIGTHVLGVTAHVVNGKINLYANTDASSNGVDSDGGIKIENGTGTILSLTGLSIGTFYRPSLQSSAHTSIPRWRSSDATPRPSGSVWHKTTAVNLGSNLSIKKFNSTLGVFIQQSCPLYSDDQSALAALDPTGGGVNIQTGTTYAQTDINKDFYETFTTKIFQRIASGQTVVTGTATNPTLNAAHTYTISASSNASTTLSTPVSVTVGGAGSASDFVQSFLAANVPYTTAAVTSTGAIQLVHTQGGVIVLSETTGTAIASAGFSDSLTNVRYGTSSGSPDSTIFILSNWSALGSSITASTTAPNQNPADLKKWYYSSINQVDIMINDNGSWKGYQNVTNDIRGYGLNNTDVAGPQISATAPTQQSDGGSLTHGDLWIDTSDLEKYPLINRWQAVNGVDQWVLLDNTDTTTENGIVFADARWGASGDIDPISDDFPSITSLLVSDYVDLDVPDAALYPDGTLLFNTRRSGFNVKEFRKNYFNAQTFSGMLPDVTNAWVSVSGNKSNGSPFMGRQSVRQIVVAALKNAIDTNMDIREEQRQFNLIACPGYPELMPNMVQLNNDRTNTAFVVGDTPLRLDDTGNSLTSWASNNNGRGTATQDGLVTTDTYMGVFYPSCQTTDLSGSTVVQPPSHMMLRTIIRSDDVSFPWLAPAGIRRGIVDNATSIGYVDSITGNFQSLSVSQGTRDVLYQNNINPITFIPGTGIVNYGNKTTQSATTALDRINVARLVAFLRARLDQIGKQFVFEPNDKTTRDEVKATIETLMNDLLSKRGIYDYLVVCDTTNNIPSTIDRNELHVDIAIEPTKSVEFIYIPVRIQNTGTIGTTK